MAIMVIFMMVSSIILEYYSECHVAFGLLVARIVFIMMLVDIMFWSMMMEMMLACGS